MQRDQLTRARQDFLSAKATVTGKQQADAALQTFYKDVLPGDSAAARKLTFTRLAQLAKQANVQLEHGTNTRDALKGSQLSKLTTSYTLTRRLPRRAEVHLLARNGARVHRPRERRADVRARRTAGRAPSR